MKPLPFQLSHRGVVPPDPGTSPWPVRTEGRIGSGNAIRDGRLFVREIGLGRGRPRVMRSRIWLESSPDFDDRGGSCSFQVEAAVTRALQPGDSFHVTQENRSCTGYAFVRGGELLLAVGALPSLALGEGIEVTESPRLASRLKALYADLDPDFESWDLPFEVTVGGKSVVAHRGFRGIGNYLLTAKHGWRPGFPDGVSVEAALVRYEMFPPSVGQTALELLALPPEDERPAPRIELELLPNLLALARLAPDAAIPAWALEHGSFVSITRSERELSIVADASLVPPEAAAAADYRALRIAGEIPLAAVGILAELARPLAEREIPVFPIATHDTDYLLVRDNDLTRACLALELAGHAWRELGE
jgi:hypothetical protein